MTQNGGPVDRSVEFGPTDSFFDEPGAGLSAVYRYLFLESGFMKAPVVLTDVEAPRRQSPVFTVRPEML